jgi:hypothetical protein
MRTGSVSTSAESFHVPSIGAQVERPVWKGSIKAKTLAKCMSAFDGRGASIPRSEFGGRDQVCQHVLRRAAFALRQLSDKQPLSRGQLDFVGVDCHVAFSKLPRQPS